MDHGSFMKDRATLKFSGVKDFFLSYQATIEKQHKQIRQLVL